MDPFELAPKEVLRGGDGDLFFIAFLVSYALSSLKHTQTASSENAYDSSIKSNKFLFN